MQTAFRDDAASQWTDVASRAPRAEMRPVAGNVEERLVSVISGAGT